MKLYLARSSSLDVMRYLRSINDGLIDGSSVRSRTLRDAISTVAQLKEFDTTAQLILSHVNGPIHAFVPRREQATRTKRLVTHVMSGEIPRGTFIDIGHGICLSSVPFLLSQLALQLDLPEWLMVGMELCGHYSRWKLAPTNREETVMAARTPSELESFTFQLRPASTIARIDSYFSRVTGIRGATQARARLKWLAERSASPMETGVYLLLCLPRHLGGYGLPKPLLNPKVIVSTPSGKRVRFPDLYWVARSVDVEYESDLEHSGEWSRYKDSKRLISLAAADITVLPLTRHQLMDVDGFDEFALSLSKLLGARRRPLPTDWATLRSQLRATVLRAN